MLNADDFKEVSERLAAVVDASTPVIRGTRTWAGTFRCRRRTRRRVIWCLRFGPGEWPHRAAAARVAPECEGEREFDAAIKVIAACAGITWAGGLFDA